MAEPSLQPMCGYLEVAGRTELTWGPNKKLHLHLLPDITMHLPIGLFPWFTHEFLVGMG